MTYESASGDELTPQDALARISHIAENQGSLRSRFEGVTWILWGLVVALQAMTLGYLEEAGLSSSVGGHTPASALSHLWILVGVVAAVGVWRAAAVNFDPGISRGRALAFFIAFPVLVSLASFGLDHTTLGAGATGFAAVMALLLVAFAVTNPVRFTRRGRWTATVLGFVAAAVAVAAWVFASPGFAWFGLAGTLIGLSWVVAGLDALYRA
jgi:hypothetical protein